MSARPLSPRRPHARRPRAALAAPALAAALALAPVCAPAALADPGLEQVLPADSAPPAEMPFGDRNSDNSGNSGNSGRSDRSGNDELQQRAEDLPGKAENFGGSVVNEIIDLYTGIIKCGLNLVTDTVPCPL